MSILMLAYSLNKLHDNNHLNIEVLSVILVRSYKLKFENDVHC